MIASAELKAIRLNPDGKHLTMLPILESHCFLV